VWRKLLIVCVFGAISWTSAEAGAVLHETRGTAEQAAAVASAGHAADARRLALVIGNADYANEPLGNPVNDARAMSQALRLLGFEVMRHENLSGQRMQEAILEFERRLGAGGIGLFYFAGHGVRVGDKTLLAPVEPDSLAPARLLTKSIDLQTVLQSMSRPRTGKLNLVILDTCLNNPFSAASAASSDAPDQTLIAYATAAGAIADDGDRQGLYTAELLKAMSVPGLEIGEVFRRAGSAVSRASLSARRRGYPRNCPAASGSQQQTRLCRTCRARPCHGAKPRPRCEAGVCCRRIAPSNMSLPFGNR